MFWNHLNIALLKGFFFLFSNIQFVSQILTWKKSFLVSFSFIFVDLIFLRWVHIKKQIPISLFLFTSKNVDMHFVYVQVRVQFQKLYKSQ